MKVQRFWDILYDDMPKKKTLWKDGAGGREENEGNARGERQG